MVGRCLGQSDNSVSLYIWKISLLETTEVIDHLLGIARLATSPGGVMQIDLETVHHSFVVKTIGRGQPGHPHRRTCRQVIQLVWHEQSAVLLLGADIAD